MFLSLRTDFFAENMMNLIGEYGCKMDSKSRLMFPAGLKKQLPATEEYRFVINRGFEQCLVLYPYESWKLASNEINRLNIYIKKYREFVRYFYRGASEIVLDGANRLLIPKNLLKYAGIEKDVVLFAYSDRIELWDKEKYESLLTDEPEGYSDLAELAMGNKEQQKQDDVS